jgi:hypothetical protein
LSDTHGEGVDLLLQHTAHIIDLLLLTDQRLGPTAELIAGAGAAMTGTQPDSDGKCTADDQENQGRCRSQYQRMVQVELLDAAALAANKNDIHVKLQAVMLEVGLGLTSNGRRLCRIR